MYSRYLNHTSYTPQKEETSQPLPRRSVSVPPQAVAKPLPKNLQLDRSDLLILLIILLTMQDDNTTMLLTAALYLFM